MSNLIERIRKARQTRVEHAGKVFIVRRPTDWEALEMRTKDTKQMDIFERFVIGWENFTELDLVPGGNSTPVEFSRELFLEWIADRGEFWSPITTAVVDEYLAHRARLEEAGKK